MLKVNKKKLKAYGDRLDDGAMQFSFTLPVSVSPEAKETAKRYIEKLGLKDVSIATMEPMGEGFSHFVGYGNAKHTIDITRIHVPKVDASFMDYEGLKEYMSDHFKEPLVVIGAAIGADAHTVGIDAIMNMKGYDHDYGLERYPLFKAHNLRSQITSEQLIEKALELKADAILISQVVTQRNSHINNLKTFKKLAKDNKKLAKDLLLIVGGPRIDHGLALKLGFDAGFGQGTKPSQVASFIVKELMKRRGIKEGVKAEEKGPKKEGDKKEVSQSKEDGRPQRSKYKKKKGFYNKRNRRPKKKTTDSEGK
ncbi:MAG: hypothetical protein HN337_10000 [Deltaproteobacteria bacterium]|jgi:beta-lysine 5,6-aminomutase beta subunit|nr:hypothetical protein [Deltaproteobacteria bacterium]